MLFFVVVRICVYRTRIVNMMGFWPHWQPAMYDVYFTSDKGGGKCVCLRLSVCLSVSKSTQKRVHG